MGGGATRGRDILSGMNLPIRSHPERSGGGKAGAAESKDPVELKRDVVRESHGVLRLRSGRKAPFAPLRMTAIWKVHWQRSGGGKAGGAKSRDPVSIAGDMAAKAYVDQLRGPIEPSTGFLDCAPRGLRPPRRSARNDPRKGISTGC